MGEGQGPGWGRGALPPPAPHQQVSGDEDAAGAGAEFPHDDVSFLLVHVTVLEGRSGAQGGALGEEGDDTHVSGPTLPRPVPPPWQKQ